MTLTIAVTGQTLIHKPLDLQGEGAQEVSAFLRADAVFANFEGVVEAEGAWPTKTKTVHAVPAHVVASLAELGFTVMGHANNHAFDLGPPGIAATRRAMADSKIAVCGSGLTVFEAMTPVRMEVDGRAVAFYSVDLGPQADIVYGGFDRPGIAPLRMRKEVSLPNADYERLLSIHQALGDDRRLAARRAVGYSAASISQGFDAFGASFVPGDRVEALWTPEIEDMARVVAAIVRSKQQGELVILSLHNHHWDSDWKSTPLWFDTLANQLIDKGCDLIVGTGAPLMQPVRFYRGRAILSGLGNFIFHTARSQTYDEKGVDVWRSVALRLELSEGGECRQMHVLPVDVGRPGDGGVAAPPRPLAHEGAQEMFDRLVSRLSSEEKECVRLHATA